MAKANLFQAAKEKGLTASPKASKEKTEVVINEVGFHADISRLAELNSQIELLTAESSMISANVKQRGIQEFGKLYEKTSKYPGSFMIVGQGIKNQPSASLMFIPTDKYIKIDEARATELQETYGTEIVTETTSYTMDQELVNKYGDAISKAIQGIKSISDDDKDKLITAVTSYSVAKGTIQKLPDFVGATIPTLLTDINPVYQLKNVKIDE